MSFDNKRYRINFQIRANSVRVSHDNNQLGIMPIDKARQYAQNQNLDLIETVPGANPPVCIVENFSKFRYENKLREKEAKKKQKLTMVVLKEIRLTPSITDHDLETKAKMVVRFLQEDKKVLVSMKFTPREMNHKDIGFQTFEKLFAVTKDFGQVDGVLKFAGQRLCCTLSPAGQKHESKST